MFLDSFIMAAELLVGSPSIAVRGVPLCFQESDLLVRDQVHVSLAPTAFKVYLEKHK